MAKKYKIDATTNKMVKLGFMDRLIMSVGVAHRLTPREGQALLFAMDSAHGNGFDFGFAQDVMQALIEHGVSLADAQKHVSALHQKGVIEIHEAVDTGDGEGWNQITFNDKLRTLIQDSYARVEKINI